MVRIPDFFIYIPTNISPFHVASFLKAARLILIDLRGLYKWISSVDQSFFQSFIAVTVRL